MAHRVKNMEIKLDWAPKGRDLAPYQHESFSSQIVCKV